MYDGLPRPSLSPARDGLGRPSYGLARHFSSSRLLRDGIGVDRVQPHVSFGRKADLHGERLIDRTRLVFGAGHPAIAFLLLLAIADDAAGLVILAVAYPQKPIEPLWLLLTLGAMATLLLAVGAVIVIPLLLAAFGVGSIGELEVLRWPMLVGLVVIGLAALYRFGPNRSSARWRWLSAGTATAIAMAPTSTFQTPFIGLTPPRSLERL